jgi:hypothetical protein
MRSRFLTTTVLATVIAVGGLSSAWAASSPPSPKPAKSTQACFWTRNVNNFRAVDDRTVNLRVGLKDVYQLVLFSSSPDIDWSQHIGIESRGGSWICSGLDATLIVPGAIGPQRYPVTSIRKLTPEEVAALPAKARP